VTHVFLARGEERSVRTAVAERYAEALRVAEHHVGTGLSRRREQREGEQVGGHRHQHLRGMRGADEASQVGDRAALVGILQQHAEHGRIVDRHLGHRAHPQLDAQGFGAALQHGQRVREHAVGRQEHAAGGELLRRHAVQQRHGFARRGAFIEQ
jgi:hypothetical protein